MFKKGHLNYNIVFKKHYRMKNCLNCDKLLIKRQERFCSVFCANKSRAKNRIKRYCLVCNKEFLAKENSGQKYCSRSCANKMNPQNRKGHFCSQEAAERISNGRRGKGSSLKGKTLIEILGLERGKKALIERKENPPFRDKHHTKETRKILSEKHIGKPGPNKGKTKENDLVTKIRCEKMKITQRSLFKNQDYKEKMLVKMRSRDNVKPTKPEIKLDSFLQKSYPGEWKYVGDGFTWIAGKNPDYLNVNGLKVVIEHLGCYYHGCPICFPERKNKNDEEKRIQHFKEYGFECLTIWEHELNNLDIVKSKVDSFCMGRIKC